MTKDIFVTITGMQTQDTGEAVEIINAGTYYKKNDMHYVLYDEVIEGFDQITKNMIKFKAGYLNVSKKGVLTSNMEFDLEKKTENRYVTPYGDMLMEIRTKELSMTETEEEIRVTADYILDADGRFLADCHIQIEIHPAKNGIRL